MRFIFGRPPASPGGSFFSSGVCQSVTYSSISAKLAIIAYAHTPANLALFVQARFPSPEAGWIKQWEKPVSKTSKQKEISSVSGIKKTCGALGRCPLRLVDVSSLPLPQPVHTLCFRFRSVCRSVPFCSPPDPPFPSVPLCSVLFHAGGTPMGSSYKWEHF